eukprot:gene6114-5967_t
MTTDIHLPKSCEEVVDNSFKQLCHMDTVIYRVSLSLVIFFSIHLLLSPTVFVCGG